jgi:hypothetical protein
VLCRQASRFEGDQPIEAEHGTDKSTDRQENVVRVGSICNQDICLEERPDLKCIDMDDELDNEL